MSDVTDYSDYRVVIVRASCLAVIATRLVLLKEWLPRAVDAVEAMVFWKRWLPADDAGKVPNKDTYPLSFGLRSVKIIGL